MIRFRNMYLLSLLIVSVSFSLTDNQVYAQGKEENIADILYFISDCQQPIVFEEILLRPFKNIEGRDSLFMDIRKHKPGNLFLLGDMVSKGSSNKKWIPVDSFINALDKQNTKIFAVPGNHEYLASAKKGITKYLKRFSAESLSGYCIKQDSVAIVMLNSNLKKMQALLRAKQSKWYSEIMDSLDRDPKTLVIVVCTHHAPYSNSKVVGSSEEVQKAFVPRFIDSPKARLFITGHSHNMEYFKIRNKNFLVIGGGGGLAQPLLKGNAQQYQDLLVPENKPLFFYITLQRKNRVLHLASTGLKKEFQRIYTTEFAEINF